MSRKLPQWLLKLLRMLFLDNKFVRRSIGGILRLLSLLRRRFEVERYLGRVTRDEIAPLPPSDQDDHVVVCASAQPPSRIPFQIHSPHMASIVSLGYGHSLHPYDASSRGARSFSSQNLSLSYEDSEGSISRPTTPLSLDPSSTPPALTILRASSVHLPISDAPDVADVWKSYLSESAPGLRIYPIVASWFERYDKKITILRTNVECPIEPCTMNFRPIQPEGWTSFTHPEGALYFYHPEKRVFTDGNLYDPENLARIRIYIDHIFDFIRSQNMELAPDVDLVLDLTQNSDGAPSCGYYFADHGERCLFWLDKFDATPLCFEVKGIAELSHLRYLVETEYWNHCEFFPNALGELSNSIVRELRDMIIHHIGDTLTSKFSTAPYSTDDLQKMLGLINNLEKNVGTQFGGATCIMSRFMCIFTRHKFLNFHGQTFARLSRDQSVYNTNAKKPSYLMMILSPVFFYAPDTHLATLKKLWVDDLVSHVSWSQAITKLNEEWQDLIINAAVLLNANISFLSIASVDNAVHGIRSPAQICSYISMVTSIGSIIIGLLLVRQNRTKAKDTAEQAASFLMAASNAPFGLETLCIMYSLPYSLLMWSMVSFLVAFSFTCYRDADGITRLMVGAFSIALLILILWCVWSAWESKEKHWWQAAWERFFPPRSQEGHDNDNEDEKSSAADRPIKTSGNEKWPRLTLRSVIDRFHASRKASMDSNATAVC